QPSRQQQGRRGHAEGDRPVKPITLDLFPGCVSNRHVIADRPGLGSERLREERQASVWARTESGRLPSRAAAQDPSRLRASGHWAPSQSDRHLVNSVMRPSRAKPALGGLAELFYPVSADSLASYWWRWG